MAHNPSEIWHPFEIDPNRDISSISKHNPNIFIPEVIEDFDKFLFEKKKGDFKYLHSHPEIKAIIIFVIGELAKHNPQHVKKFCSELFHTYQEDCLMKIINGILSCNEDSRKSKQSATKIQSTTRSTTTSEKENNKCFN